MHLSIRTLLSSPRHRQQIVHLSIRTPLQVQDSGNRSCILAFGHQCEAKEPATNHTSKHSDTASSPRHRQEILHRSIRTQLRAQDTGNKSYILAFGPHFEPKTPATNRTSWHSDPASSPRHRQQIEHLSIRTPLRAQDTGNNLCILAFGPRF